MKITVTNARVNLKNKSAANVFFDTLIEEAGMAFIILGWKFVDGKMYPPQKKVRGGFYNEIQCSPQFAQRVQKAAEEAGVGLLTVIEEDSWVSSKWGLSALTSSMPDNPEFAKDVWEYYKKPKGETENVSTTA